MPKPSTGWEPLQPRDEHLDNKAALWVEMCCGVAEARDLLILRCQVHDRVRDDVSHGVPALDGRGREVSDRDADLFRTRLDTQTSDHRLGQVDAMHGDATLRKRQRDPAGANPKFEGATGTGTFSDEVNDRVDDCRRVLVRVPLVKASGHALAKVILRH